MKRNDPAGNALLYSRRDEFMGSPMITWHTPEMLVWFMKIELNNRYIDPPKGRYIPSDLALADCAMTVGFDIADVWEVMSGRPRKL